MPTFTGYDPIKVFDNVLTLNLIVISSRKLTPIRAENVTLFGMECSSSCRQCQSGSTEGIYGAQDESRKPEK